MKLYFENRILHLNSQSRLLKAFIVPLNDLSSTDICFSEKIMTICALYFILLHLIFDVFQIFWSEFS